MRRATEEQEPAVLGHICDVSDQSGPQLFQSCHGKGPSDSEGAVVKSSLRRLAFVFGKRANDSKQAFEFCIGDEGRALRERNLRGETRRHSIMSSEFYIPAGVVDHLTITELKPVDGIKSHFCFVGLSCS